VGHPQVKATTVGNYFWKGAGDTTSKAALSGCKDMKSDNGNNRTSAEGAAEEAKEQAVAVSWSSGLSAAAAAICSATRIITLLIVI